MTDACSCSRWDFVDVPPDWTAGKAKSDMESRLISML